MDYEKFDNFKDFHLDDRLLKAISDLKFSKPTNVQEGVIPMALSKKNIIIAARTGSGKTAAYMIPIIQDLLLKNTDDQPSVSVLILCPTKDLCNQTLTNLQNLLKYTDLSSVNISGQSNIKHLKPVLVQRPDFVIGTPSQVIKIMEDKLLNLSDLTHVVIDEADLMCGFCYKDDITRLLKIEINHECQFMLLSATIDQETTEIRKLVDAKWFKCELNDSEMLPSSGKLTQYVKHCAEDEKYNILISMLKFKLIRGKTLIFTNNVDKCYRLKYMLDAFYIRSVLLNSELPIASRSHIIHEFNRGKYDLLLASDEEKCEPIKKKVDKRNRENDEDGKTPLEYRVSRGVDFQSISNVINFDCPPDVTSYIHRVGRTARVDSNGAAVTFVNSIDSEVFDKINKELQVIQGEAIFQQYHCPQQLYEGMAYRIQETRAKCTKAVIKQARLLDIRKELENCSLLKNASKDATNKIAISRNLQSIVPDKSTALKDIPDYMLPKKLQAQINHKMKTPKKKTHTKKNVPGKKAGAKNPLASIKIKKNNKKPQKK